MRSSRVFLFQPFRTATCASFSELFHLNIDHTFRANCGAGGILHSGTTTGGNSGGGDGLVDSSGGSGRYHGILGCWI